jgi:hypothetical protein
MASLTKLVNLATTAKFFDLVSSELFCKIKNKSLYLR